MNRPHNWGTGQCKVAHRVQQLVTGELVRHAQPGGVQHTRLIDHDGIVETATPGEARRRASDRFLGEPERACVRQLVTEALRRQAKRNAWRPIAARVEIDGQRQSKAGVAGPRRSKFDEAGAVANTHRTAYLDHRPWRRLFDGAGTIEQEHEWRGRSVEDRRFRPIDLDQDVVDRAAGERRHQMLDRANPGGRPIKPQHGGKPGIHHMIETRRNVDSKISAAEDDAVVRWRRLQGDVDAQSGMQTYAHAPIDAFNVRWRRLVGPGTRLRGRPSIYLVSHRAAHLEMALATAGAS